MICNNTRISIGSVLIGPAYIGNDIRPAQNVVFLNLSYNYSDITTPICKQGEAQRKYSLETVPGSERMRSFYPENV